MTKQMKTAMAAMLMVGTLPMQAQTSQTDVVKVAPGQTKKTVIHRKNGATDTVISVGASTGSKHHARRRTAKVHVESATERQLRELQEKQTAQQAEIDALTQANAAKDAQLAAAQSAAQQAETQAQAATAQAQTVTTTVQANTDAVQSLKSNVNDLQTANVGLATTISANKTELVEKIESPTTLHYKGVTITPVAFFAFEGVYRQRAINSDINTPFNTTPFEGATDAHTSELNFSGRQSRLGGLFEGKTPVAKLSGYFESDFLSAGATSNNNQSNSYTFRVRQIWGKAETNGGFAVTGGQTWSLLTENGKSTDVRTEKLPNTIDPQYMVGYTWARQPGIRLQQKFKSGDNAFTVAVAAEQAQIIYSGTTNAPTNFEFGAPGQGGGLYNAYSGNYTSNIAPDVIAKVALDTKNIHLEAAGIGRSFRDRVYPAIGSASTGYVAGSEGTAPYNDVKEGGGVEAGARFTSKFLDVAATGMYGAGIGRYGSSQLSDVTVHPDGKLEPIKNGHGLFSLETHPAKKLDIYAYYGGEYAQRTVYATGSLGSAAFTGYGAINANDTGCQTEVPPATGGFTGSVTPSGPCAGATRYIQEGMFGFTYKAINSPKYGRLQYQFTYSYLQRQLWEGVTTGAYGGPTAAFGAPKAINNMVHFGMRYYIP